MEKNIFLQMDFKIIQYLHQIFFIFNILVIITGVESWKSAGMLQESIKNPHTADIIFSTDLIDNYSTMVGLVK